MLFLLFLKFLPFSFVLYYSLYNNFTEFSLLSFNLTLVIHPFFLSSIPSTHHFP